MKMISLDSLSKEYKLGQLTGLKDSLQNVLQKLRGGPTLERQRFLAINDISMSINKGEVVGIIGQNGAGKSTLLKLISGITIPTSGEIKIGGSIAPLIEVGAGLNPELTGRENIFLNAAILGVSKKIIREKIDDIVEFSELSEFIDTPLKRYSSGMQVRLGFSIATSLEADILIVDEVLAVGDLAFQRKCFDRIEQMLRGDEKTVLIVSHNIRQIARLCDRAILLDHGEVIADGPSAEICNLFYERSNEKVLSQKSGGEYSNSSVRSSGELELDEVEILDENNRPTDNVNSGDDLLVRIRFKLNRSFTKPEITIGTHTTDFVYLTSSSTAAFAERPDFEAGVHEVRYIIKDFPFVPGVYCIRFMMHDEFGRGIFLGETLKVFAVRPTGREQVEENAKNRIVNVNSEWLLSGNKFSYSQSRPGCILTEPVR